MPRPRSPIQSRWVTCRRSHGIDGALGLAPDLARARRDGSIGLLARVSVSVSVASAIVLAACLAVAAAGCGGPLGSPALRGAPTGASSPSAEPLGLGRPASPEAIAAWDIDVRPDGLGLPEGSGSVEAGRALYAERCAHCHGAEGEGGPFDRLVGRNEGDAFRFATDPRAIRTIGSYWPFATTLFDYTRRAMPQDRPGSLGDDEVYALTAFLLHRNGLLAADAVLDRDTLPAIEMPARDRFVPDDRRGGAEVR